MTEVTIGPLDGAATHPVVALRSIPYDRADVADDHILLGSIDPIETALVDGYGTVELLPTVPGLGPVAWRFEEILDNGDVHYVRQAVLVPDSLTALPYADLVDVDPGTGEPLPLLWDEQLAAEAAARVAADEQHDEDIADLDEAVTDVEDDVMDLAEDVAAKPDLSEVSLGGNVPAIWFVDAMAGADDNARRDAAVAAWAASGRGGKIVLGAGPYTWTTQLAIPNDLVGDPTLSIPKQKTLIIEGQGASHNGAGGGINGGTIVDWTYNGTIAKLDSRGSGLLMIRDITFRDLVNDTPPPFIQVTNTTPIFERCEFWGKNAQEVAATDCISLGGGTRDIDGTATAKFNGYKPIVKDCHFHRARRCVWLRPGCNDGLISGNTVWTDCGAPDNTYGAIDLIGANPGSIVGNVIADNTLESSHYPNVILVGDYAKSNVFRHNGIYDPTATTVCGIRFADNAMYNIVEPGYWDGSFDYFLESIVSKDSNTVGPTSAASRASIFAQPVLMKGSAVTVRTAGRGVAAIATNGDRGYIRTNGGSAASPSYPETIVSTSNAQLVTDLATTNGSNVVTSATGAFAPEIKGMPIAATGIPNNSTILRVVNTTTLWISNNATATASGVTAQIGRSPANTGGTEVDEVGFARRHIITKGAIGAAAKGAAAGGSNSTVSATGTDTAFTIDLTTHSSGTGTGTLCTVTFGVAFQSSKAIPMLQPLNAAAAHAIVTNEVYCSTSNSVFTLTCGAGTPAVSTNFLFAVHVLQA